MPWPVHEVYPRVCGGTEADGDPCPESEGLSPRVRGNQVFVTAVRPVVRSIPACAGEPTAGQVGSHTTRVYPRVCGGTRRPVPKHHVARGLSPRVRGNRRFHFRRSWYPGSIPACAGEPTARPPAPLPPWVYPRVCGGTTMACWRIVCSRGLSPRVRGNRRAGGRLAVGPGSIPACAGEPSFTAGRASPPRVYPRVCGGTTASSDMLRARPGLSPRVRGNLRSELRMRHLEGSIPACAGEPFATDHAYSGVRVYPRVCGGTAT